MASLKSFLSILVFLAFASDAAARPNIKMFLKKNPLAFTSDAAARPNIKMFPKKNPLQSDDNTDDDLCESWKFSFEANNLRNFTGPLECVPFIKKYIHHDDTDTSRYLFDILYAAASAYEFAETVKISSKGKDAWIFDVDETLLSNLPYIEKHGSEPFNKTEFYEWAAKAKAPANLGALFLYEGLQELGFKIIILTGRDESARDFTEKNLRNAGYSNWDKLIMRESFDKGKDAIVYKSERRLLLELEGYKLHGNTGDQWSDLLGVALATRSFKFPNPLYYVP